MMDNSLAYWDKQVLTGEAKVILEAWKAEQQKPSIALLSNGDDGEWLYVSGKLTKEGHRITLRDFCEALGYAYEYRDFDSGEYGEIRPPENLKDLK